MHTAGTRALQHAAVLSTHDHGSCRTHAGGRDGPLCLTHIPTIKCAVRARARVRNISYVCARHLRVSAGTGAVLGPGPAPRPSARPAAAPCTAAQADTQPTRLRGRVPAAAAARRTRRGRARRRAAGSLGLGSEHLLLELVHFAVWWNSSACLAAARSPRARPRSSRRAPPCSACARRSPGCRRAPRGHARAARQHGARLEHAAIDQRALCRGGGGEARWSWRAPGCASVLHPPRRLHPVRLLRPRTSCRMQPSPTMELSSTVRAQDAPPWSMRQCTCAPRILSG